MPFGSYPLNDGHKIPAIAYGTGTANYGKDVTDEVEQALESGFIHIDTAQQYGNEDSVGEGIQESALSRDEIYVTTKYSIRGDIRRTAEQSLKKLGLKYVDLYLIHHPQIVSGSLEESWREIEALKDDGLAKSIGVSNFNLEQLQALLKIAKIKPAANQIRLHPYNWAETQALVEYSTQHGIVTEAYSSLIPITRNPGGPVDPVLKDIGKRLGATPAQVIFAWVKSKGIVIVTTTSKKERLKEYLDVGDLPSLTDAEITAIEEAGAKGPPSILRQRLQSASGRVFTLLTVAALVVFLRFIRS